MAPKSERKKYTVVHGKDEEVVHSFDCGEDAVRHLLDHPGYAKLYGPDGLLLMTKGRHDQDMA